MTAENETVAALIPAKGISRRIPRKNVAEICGKPLVYFSIKVAQLVDEISDVFVSTEDEEIAGIGAAIGAKLIMRPESLCRDDVTNFNVMQHAVSMVEEHFSYLPDLLVLLQPTQPFRTPQLLKESIGLIRRHPRADALVTVSRITKPVGNIKDDVWDCPTQLPNRLSDSTPRFMIDGTLFIFRTRNTIKQDMFLGHHIVAQEMPADLVSLDIDTIPDLKLARYTMQENKQRYPFFFETP